MNSNALLRKYNELKDKEHGPREINRFYSSELSKIRLGWFKPKDFFDPKPIDDTGLGNINRGIAYEEQWAKIFSATTDLKHEPEKKELKIDDFVIVSKPDFMSDKVILEMKTPTVRSLERYIFKGKVIPWNADQAECYYRTFNKDVYFAIAYDTPEQNFCLATLKYKPDDALWEKTLKSLRAFHAKLKEITK